MSTLRAMKYQPKLEQGPNGRNLCRFCRQEVPEGRRKTLCSAKCDEEFHIRISPSYARRLVHERDRGVCAICRLDTDELKRQYQREKDAAQREHDTAYMAIEAECNRRFIEHLNARPRPRDPFVSPLTKLAIDLSAALRTIDQRFLARGFKPGRSFWEADHLLPVIEGGGECGLEGLRTLCVPCHKQVTRELRGRMARRPTKAFVPLNRR